MMNPIRPASTEDICRLAEIEIFNYRLNFYPIFQNDGYYFKELQVTHFMNAYQTDPMLLKNTYVYDDGTVKGFIRFEGEHIQKLFVEPVLQGHSIGSALLEFVLSRGTSHYLWALEKNTRAINFYLRHGFTQTDEKELEEDTTEYLIKLIR